MKRSKTITGAFVLTALTAICGLVTGVGAQGRVKCDGSVEINSLYLTDAATAVTTAHPGPYAGAGRSAYQIRIIGTNVDKLEVIRERYMASLDTGRVYANTSTQAIWRVSFAPNKHRTITAIRMTDKCSGETREYKLDSQVELYDQ